MGMDLTLGGNGSVVIPIAPAALTGLVGAPINPVLTIIATWPAAHAPMQYQVAEGRHPRVDATITILDGLHRIATAAGMPVRFGEPVVIQTEDVPVRAAGVSWEAQADWNELRLIPDLYYLQAGGYQDFDPILPQWDERADRIVWRGSTTGLFWQVVGDLDGLPRYCLCRAADRLGDRADVGIADVVQAADPTQAELIRERLRAEGYLRAFIPFADMARYRYIMDIDGNSNSWNFMMKLRLGCCVLRVESRWRQWFHDRLKAWEHYVPVREDLSDLEEKAGWCFAHTEESAAIAERGRQLALGMVFEEEQRNAARRVFAARDAGAVA